MLLLAMFQSGVESDTWPAALSQTSVGGACFSYHSKTSAWTLSENTTKNCTFLPYNIPQKHYFEHCNYAIFL